MFFILQGRTDHVDTMRLRKLAGFQKKVLEHALSCKADTHDSYTFSTDVESF